MGILVALGVDQALLTGKHQSCPFCQSGVDRFRWTNKDNQGWFYCSQCGAGDGIEYIRRHLSMTYAQACKEVDSIIGTLPEVKIHEQRSEADKIAAIKRTLRECRPVERGDPVWTYLNRRTGVENVPVDLKFHHGLYHKSGGSHPAMVAIVRDVAGHGVTLHRTYLTAAGEKADVDPVRMFMPGRDLHGAAVRLSRVADVIGIGEGIETALAASAQFDVPVWAATNALLLEKFIPPAGIKHVIVFGDSDSSWTGQAAAYSLAKRLWRENIYVDVQMPEGVDVDWCDARK